jgi:hypothetical protein
MAIDEVEKYNAEELFRQNVRALFIIEPNADTSRIERMLLPYGMPENWLQIAAAEKTSLQHESRNNASSFVDWKKYDTGVHYKHGEAPAGTPAELIDPPTI